MRAATEGSDAVVVEERLPHPHEHDAPHRMLGVGGDLDDLIDNFPGLQVAAKAQPRRGAERAAQRAADLRADADDVFAILRPVQQRDADRFKRLGSGAAEEVFREAVRGRRRDLE